MPTTATPENHRVVELHGQDVTVKQFSFGSENTYDTKPRNEDSSSTVRALVDRSGGAVERDAAGVTRTRDLRITVKDTVTVTDSEPATRFVVDSVTYEVEHADDMNNGLIEATATRIDKD